MPLDPTISLQGISSPNAAISAGVDPFAIAQKAATLQATQQQIAASKASQANTEAQTPGLQAQSQQLQFAAQKQKDIKDIQQKFAKTNPDGTPVLNEDGTPAYDTQGMLGAMSRAGYVQDAAELAKSLISNASSTVDAQQKALGYAGTIINSVPESHQPVLWNAFDQNLKQMGLPGLPQLPDGTTPQNAGAAIKTMLPGIIKGSMSVPEQQSVSASQAVTNTTPEETNPDSQSSQMARGQAGQFGVPVANTTTASQIANTPYMNSPIASGNNAGVNTSRGAQLAAGTNPGFIADQTTLQAGIRAAASLAQKYPGINNKGSNAYANAIALAQSDPDFATVQRAVAVAKAAGASGVDMSNGPSVASQGLQQFYASRAQGASTAVAQSVQPTVSGAAQASQVPTAPAQNPIAPTAGSPAAVQQNASIAAQQARTNGAPTPVVVSNQDQYDALPNGAPYMVPGSTKVGYKGRSAGGQ